MEVARRPCFEAWYAPVLLVDTCLVASFPRMPKLRSIGHPIDKPPHGLVQDDWYSETQGSYLKYYSKFLKGDDKEEEEYLHFS